MKRFLLFAGILLLCGIPLSGYSFYEEQESGDGVPPPIRPSSESSNTLSTTRALSIELVQVEVFDANQQLLYTGTAMVYANRLIMDTSALPKGTYTAVAKTTGKLDRIFTVECN